MAVLWDEETSGPLVTARNTNTPAPFLEHSLNGRTMPVSANGLARTFGVPSSRN